MIGAYQPADTQAIAVLFHAAVHAIDNSLYGEAQKRAWSPAVDAQTWRLRLHDAPRTWVCREAGCSVGFITLGLQGYIAFLYVHPQHQRRGIAQMLYDTLEQHVREQGLVGTLSADASKASLPFFIRNGYVLVRENTACRGTEGIVNYAVSKPLKTAS